jgi:hypothetical protein
MNSSLKHLISVTNKVLPRSVQEINHVLSRPYWEGVNVGEAFERIFSGFANEAGYDNDFDGKRGSVVDIRFHNPSYLVQVKTTHPLTKKPKGSFQFCRSSGKYLDEAVLDVRGKFFRVFNRSSAKEFYLLHHDFKARKTIIYHLASKKERVKFHGEFLSGNNGYLSKDYLVIPKSDLVKVWEKEWGSK